MNDSMGQQLNKAIEQLQKILRRHFLTEALLLIEFGSQIPSITVLLHDVVVVLSLDHIDELHDIVGMQFLHDFDFGYVGFFEALILVYWVRLLVLCFLDSTLTATWDLSASLMPRYTFPKEPSPSTSSILRM